MSMKNTKKRLQEKLLTKKTEYYLNAINLLPLAFKYYNEVLIKHPEYIDKCPSPSIWLLKRIILSKNWKKFKNLIGILQTEICVNPYYKYTDLMSTYYEDLSDEIVNIILLPKKKKDLFELVKSHENIILSLTKQADTNNSDNSDNSDNIQILESEIVD